MEPNLKEQFIRIFIHRDSIDTSVGQRVLQFFPQERIEIVESQPLAEKNGELSAEDFSLSKRLLYVAPHKGHFFKRCPGAKPGLTCCNYFILNLGLQCNMNCSYCYLQSYINTPVLTIYSNIEDALKELKIIADSDPNASYRLGTGETTDSLSLDEITLYSHTLIQFFRNHPNWKLELKTKSSKVDQFLNIEHAGNIICSWSINPENIVQSEEHLTASLEDRIRAARKCRDHGFQVSFNIDPMIWHPDWETNYKNLVDCVARYFQPEDIIYITVGALRFQPEQRHIMRERFGLKSFVTHSEMWPSKDGKLRYDFHVRNEMFDFIKTQFKNNSPQWRISLCMEVPETWSMTMASTPKKMPELSQLF